MNVRRSEETWNIIQCTSIPTKAAEDAVVGNQPNPAEDKIGFVEYCDVD
jgi:transcriptional regulator of aromatic amino acid metabolism